MESFHGLPIHPLIVHAVVVLLPLAALAVVLHALWPPAARWLGATTPLLALACVVLVPLAASAGRSLEAALHAESNPLVRRHEQLAGQLLPWTVGLAVVALAQWGLRRYAAAVLRRRWMAALLAVVSLVAAIGVTVTVARVGEAGSRAVWSGVPTS